MRAQAQDKFLSNAIKTGYKTIHVWLNFVRARRMAYWISRKSLPAVFISSIIYMSHRILKSYINAVELARKGRH